VNTQLSRIGKVTYELFISYFILYTLLYMCLLKICLVKIDLLQKLVWKEDVKNGPIWIQKGVNKRNNAFLGFNLLNMISLLKNS